MTFPPVVMLCLVSLQGQQPWDGQPGFKEQLLITVITLQAQQRQSFVPKLTGKTRFTLIKSIKTYFLSFFFFFFPSL